MVNKKIKVINKLSPFFKCPGGKRRLLIELHKHLPKDFFTNNYTYIEPFVGGGALALSILEQSSKQKIIINDSNLHIANLWKSIKHHPKEMMQHYDFLIKFYKEDVNRYLTIRDNLPLLNKNFCTLEAEKLLNSATEFLYLNKNTYNGLIRFNKSGKFNAPPGKYKKVQMYNKELILNVSKAIQKVDIYSKDFQEVINNLKITKTSAKKLFFYFDPPYAPLSKTSNFTGYTVDGFSTYDQYRLKSSIDFLDFIGAKFMLSNSDSDLVKTLYKQYNIHKVKAPRVINSKGTKRGKISEYIITNY